MATDEDFSETSVDSGQDKQGKASDIGQNGMSDSDKTDGEIRRQSDWNS